MIMAARRIWRALPVLILLATPLSAQDVDVPRTRTLPGLAAPAFPYVSPESVGMSSAKLDSLGNAIESWVANGELVGAELLIVKRGRAVFHEAYGWADHSARDSSGRSGRSRGGEAMACRFGTRGQIIICMI